MSDLIQLTSDRGTLRISHPLPELKSVLCFKHVFTSDEGSVTFFDRALGKERTIKKKGKITSQLEPLYAEGPDGALYTHDGCLSMVANTLTKLGFRYDYERLAPHWPEPALSASVVKGLYPEQREAVIRLLSSTGGGMVEAATSMGKTRLIAALIRSFPKQKIVVMTHRQSVVRGLVKNLSELLFEDGIEIGICQGTNQDHRRVTVSTIGSAHHLDCDQIGVFIADEVHRFSSPSASEVALGFTRALKYGVSATISGKFNGTSKFLESLFGPIVYTVEDKELEGAGRVPPIDAYFLSVPQGPAVDHLSGATLKKKGLWNNYHRNQLVKRVLELAPEDQQVLVFVETVKHLEEIVQVYPGLEVCHSKMPASARKKIEERFTSGEALRVISTDTMSEGVDPKKLMIMIDCSAVKGDSAMAQKRGRLRRPGKARGVLVNFQDEWSSQFSRKALTRIKDHKKRGDTVFEMAVPEDIKFMVLDSSSNPIDDENIAPENFGQDVPSSISSTVP